ncbi:hypothetical protein [Maridesulfovibrio sp. FT414]
MKVNFAILDDKGRFLGDTEKKKPAQKVGQAFWGYFSGSCRLKKEKDAF